MPEFKGRMINTNPNPCLLKVPRSHCHQQRNVDSSLHPDSEDSTDGVGPHIVTKNNFKKLLSVEWMMMTFWDAQGTILKLLGHRT